MGLTVTGSTNLDINLTRKNPLSVGTSASKSVQGTVPQKKIAWVSGSGGNPKELDLLYQEEVTIAANTTITRDLNALVDPDIAEAGVLTTQIYRKLRMLILFTDAANLGDIEFGAAAINGFLSIFKDLTDRIVMQKGFYQMWVNEDNDLGTPSGAAHDIIFFNNDVTNANKITMILAGTTT